jgi:hypothetical protein
MDTKYTRRLEKIEGALDQWLPEAPDSVWLEKVFAPFSPTGTGRCANLNRSVFLWKTPQKPCIMPIIKD